MEYFEPMCIIDFYFVANVRAVNDGNIVSVARLYEIDSLVKIHRLIHDNYIVESTGESQIKIIKQSLEIGFNSYLDPPICYWHSLLRKIVKMAIKP